MKKFTNAGILLLLICWAAGCTKNPAGPEYRKEITIWGFLWGDRPVDREHAILITQTQPLDRVYTLGEAGVADAIVTLTDETLQESYHLTHTDDEPGFYYNENVRVRPNTTYTLTVRVDGETIWAATTVPPRLIQTTGLCPDAINPVYPKNLGYEKPIFVQTEDENRLILVDMFCNEPFERAEYIAPFHESWKYPSSQDEYDGGRNAEPRHIMALVPFRDLLSPEFGNRHAIFWYASMIVFYGSNTLTVSAIDDNYHHYLTDEHPHLSGGVEGGIGVFGSVYGEKYELAVRKAE